jgi:hypothetical protein
VRWPSRVVTVTFEMRGLFLKVLVSVLTPFESTLVVISELSGPAVVVGLLAAIALALSVPFWVQPAASAASITIINTKLSLLTLFSPPNWVKLCTKRASNVPDRKQGVTAKPKCKVRRSLCTSVQLQYGAAGKPPINLIFD